jgi:hypothetical protein
MLNDDATNNVVCMALCGTDLYVDQLVMLYRSLILFIISVIMRAKIKRGTRVIGERKRPTQPKNLNHKFKLALNLFRVCVF